MRPEYSKYFKEPRLVFGKLLEYASPLFPDDERYLKILYRLKVGESLDLENPRSYTAQIQWLKLNYRKPSLNQYVDKYEVKKIVADTIGAQYVIPTLGIWDRIEDIDFDALPDKFVLKGTHDSKSTVICRDKRRFDRESALKKLRNSLCRNNYPPMREWAYKDVRPRIIAEKLMEDPAHPEGLVDYKFFCFDGKVRASYLATGREQGKVCFDFFDRDFNHLPAFNEHHPHASVPLPKPENYEEMVRIAETLSQGFPHVRMDLYSIGNDRTYFGEYTFYHAGGMSEFIPREWDYTFGSWFRRPEPIR